MNKVKIWKEFSGLIEAKQQKSERIKFENY